MTGCELQRGLSYLSLSFAHNEHGEQQRPQCDAGNFVIVSTKSPQSCRYSWQNFSALPSTIIRLLSHLLHYIASVLDSSRWTMKAIKPDLKQEVSSSWWMLPGWCATLASWPIWMKSFPTKGMLLQATKKRRRRMLLEALSERVDPDNRWQRGQCREGMRRDFVSC